MPFKGDSSEMTVSGKFVIKYPGCWPKIPRSANLAVGSEFSTFDPLKLRRCGIFIRFLDRGVFKVTF